jgi:hypothetical protein
VDVLNELVKELAPLLDFIWANHPEKWFSAIDEMFNLFYYRANGPSPRQIASAQQGVWSYRTIYRRRKRGALLFDQLTRIERGIEDLRHDAQMNTLRWAMLFEREGLFVDHPDPDEPGGLSQKP